MTNLLPGIKHEAWTPRSHQEAVAQYVQTYDNGVQDGTIVPFVYPAFSYGGGLALLFLLIPPTSRLHSPLTRYAVFGLVAYWQAQVILYQRAFSPSTAFGVGLISAWFVLWTASLLVFKDAKTEFWRIERHGSGHEGAVQDTGGHVETPDKVLYSRQYYPAEFFFARVNWVLELYLNCRGIGWNWKITGMPSLPSGIQTQLQSTDTTEGSIVDRPVTKTGVSRFDDRRSLISHNLYLFLRGYLIVDLLKTVMHHDPYFWGQIHSSPPEYFPTIFHSSRFILRTYHLCFCMAWIWMGLRSLMALEPLFFSGVLGTHYAGVNGEPWMHPDQFGSGWNVLDRGLAGAWGGWWHQAFRSAFQMGGEWLTDVLHVHRRSNTGKLIMLFVAFAFSGFLHASASYTQLGPTHPITGIFAFFMLQAVGVVLEMGWHEFLKSSGISQRIPTWLGRLANGLGVFFWFWLTGPLVADDMALGGFFLPEPNIISPLRGLGFGVEGDGWYCWRGEKIRWYSDPRRWWLKGFAV
ncbi:MAG: hypothetical protein M1828_006378 [Chrysothrix sp. TS-e1954]|nr:MAG: hypothetical protein M1828_006378 [Chrysothrix sp. TS-e1954]